MDFTQSYSVEWRLVHVNKDTWADGSPVGTVSSVSIERSADEEVPLLESASFEVQIPLGQEWENGWYRFEGLFEQEGGSERIAMGTFLVEAASDKVDFGTQSSTMDGWSVLKPAADVYMAVGDYVPQGVDGAAYAADLLSQSIIAPVSVSGSFTLGDPIVYGKDSSVLKVVWDLLDAGGYCIRISGDGEVTISPKPQGGEWEPYDTKAALFPGVERELDLTAIPNVYRAYSETSWAEAVNDSADSSISTVSRGRRVEMVDTSPTRINGETLAQYCARRLEEESTLFRSFTYTREFDPDTRPFDIAKESLPEIGMEGDMRIVSQSIECGPSVKVTQKSSIEVKEFTA
jgi:hypothetical protein